MKPFFVSSLTEKLQYRRSELINEPVNLNLCTAIQKSRMRWYPDNKGIPTIKFKGIDVEWVYEDEKTRDQDFERIKNNEF